MGKFKQLIAFALAIGLVAVACGDDDSAGSGTTPATTAPVATTSTAPAETTTTAAAATTIAPTTTAAPATTVAAPMAVFEITADGEVTIDWAALEGVFFIPPASGSTDPFFHVHNNPDTDGFFLSIEAYTTGYGTAWAGELGMSTIDCSPGGSGICVHFDPDGTGPIGDLGADFLASGDIEIVQADADGFEAVLSGVTFTDGTTIPGPLTMTG